MIRLALRFDDPSATSDCGLEEGIFTAARAAGISLTVAVIPVKSQAGEWLHLSKARADHLIRACHDGVIEVAQHGYSHEPAQVGEKPPSEFRNVDFKRQLEKIRTGRSILEALFGKTITGFVPPWNTYDARTTNALVQSGFRYLSASGEMDADCASGLAYLPRTCQMTTLQSTLDALGGFVSFDPVVIAVMHHYDFVESGNPQATTDLKRFGALLNNLTQNAQLEVSTLSKLTNAACASISSRHQQNAWDKLPWRIRHSLPGQALFLHTWPRLILHSLFHSS